MPCHPDIPPLPRAERGAATVEYVVLAAFIAALLIAVLALLGGQLRGGFERFQQEFAAQGGTT